jgi:hypothetical protein
VFPVSLNRRGMIFGNNGSDKRPGDVVEFVEFYPQDDHPAGSSQDPVVFGMPESESLVMTKSMAKERYLLRDADFEKAGLKPFYGVYAQMEKEDKAKTREGAGNIGNIKDEPYLVQDLERATLMRYGSEKEFRREQLRREIKRRRRSGRSSIKDLPWDPALGNRPESVIHEPVGQRAVHTAIATNSVVMVGKLGAFVVTGSASVLSEVIHSLADVGNQCLLAVGIAQSLREADSSHPYGYATDRSPSATTTTTSSSSSSSPLDLLLSLSLSVSPSETHT